MRFRNGSELFQMHGGHFTIVQLWLRKRTVGRENRASLACG